MKRMMLLAAVLAATVLGPAATAAEPIDLEANPRIEQFDGIRQALDTEQYAEITANDRRTVLDLLDRMQAQLEGGGLEAMSADQKARLFNLQEQANVILVNAAEDSRLVCRRERKVGTRLATTECLTVAQRRWAQEQAHQRMRDALPDAAR